MRITALVRRAPTTTLAVPSTALEERLSELHLDRMEPALTLGAELEMSTLLKIVAHYDFSTNSDLFPASPTPAQIARVRAFFFVACGCLSSADCGAYKSNKVSRRTVFTL